MKNFLILSFLFFNILFAHHVVIIIPGTWASDSDWYKVGGDFFEAIKISAKNDIKADAVMSFNWSGDYSHKARYSAAQQLVVALESYPASTEFTIIGHSHGGNVAILASQMLKTNCIKTFYGLAVPVDNEIYYPNMNVIQKHFNLFSWEDLVQLIASTDRMYKAHERIWNISVKIGNVSPDHIDMHHQLVGKWIFNVEKVLKENKNWVINFKLNNFDYGIEMDRSNKLEIDRYVAQQIINSPGSDKSVSIECIRH